MAWPSVQHYNTVKTMNENAKNIDNIQLRSIGMKFKNLIRMGISSSDFDNSNL